MNVNNEQDRIRAELLISAACQKPAHIDILMVAHNQPEFVTNALQSVIDTVPDHHFYIHDNASSDETADILNKIDLRGGRLTRSSENLGFIKPNNVLVSQGTSPYIILLNTDVYCLPGWWEPLIGCLQNYPEVGVVGYLGGRLNNQGVGTQAVWGYDVDYISGWCLALRRSDYEKFGLFDETNLEFAYCEDADFCFRLREAGMKTYAFSLNLVWHKGHTTSTIVAPHVLQGPLIRNHQYIQRRWQKYIGRSSRCVL